MPLSKKQKIVGVLAGVLGVVQGLFYSIFSLLCLIYYYKDLTVDPRDLSFITAVYIRFLDSTYTDLSPDLIITDPLAFSAFNWIYVVFNFGWSFVAYSQVCEIAKNDQKLYKTMRLVVSITAFISTLDLVLVVGLGIDYNETCVNPASTFDDELCQKAVIPVLIIVAKGFVFWVVNVVFIYLLKKISGMLRAEAQTSPSVETTGVEISSVEVMAVEMSSVEITTSPSDADSEYNGSVGRVPRTPRYTYKWQYRYRPETEMRFDWRTGRMESYYNMVWSYGRDYVLTYD